MPSLRNVCKFGQRRKTHLPCLKQNISSSFFPLTFPGVLPLFLHPPPSVFSVCTYFHSEWCHRLTLVSLFPSLLILPTFQTFFIPGRNRAWRRQCHLRTHAQGLSLPPTTSRGRYSPGPPAAGARSQPRLGTGQPQGRGLDPEFYPNQCQCPTFLTDS